jgi:hypothetical protein
MSSLEYRKPGVYVEENLRSGIGDVGVASTATLFVGAAPTGPINIPIRFGSWSEYVSIFGGFNTVDDGTGTRVRSYLPYSVYSYFQNGGRPAFCVRTVASGEGAEAFGFAVVGDVDDAEEILVSAQNLTSENGVVSLVVGTGTGLVSGDEIAIVVDDEPLYSSGTKRVPITITGTGATTKINYFLPDAPDTDGAEEVDAVITAYTKRLFKILSRSVGDPAARDALRVVIAPEGLTSDSSAATGVFSMSIFAGTDRVERFRFLTMGESGDGVTNVFEALNDEFRGSRYVRLVSDSNTDDTLGSPGFSTSSTEWVITLSQGVDPGLPAGVDFTASAQEAAKLLDQPLLVVTPGYHKTDGTYQSADGLNSSTFPDRRDVFVINDGVDKRSAPEQSSSAYANSLYSSALAENLGDSYVASYAPWIVVSNPNGRGVITVPPGGAVAGVISRVDTTVGVFRAPAGLMATINNAVGVDAQFSDSELGLLNARNINVIRPVVGTGIAIMGARTRKMFGVDRYVNTRRTLIYLRETMRRATEFALFENNDARLWDDLRAVAERILRPLWEAGGLRGNNSGEAYFIKCDSENNTPQTVAAGEVRLDIGVALETPAEFIIIRVTQYERGGSSVDIIS